MGVDYVPEQSAACPARSGVPQETRQRPLEAPLTWVWGREGECWGGWVYPRVDALRPCFQVNSSTGVPNSSCTPQLNLVVAACAVLTNFSLHRSC